MADTKYAHTSIVARDWERLSGFYEKVFGCTVVPPERSQSGSLLEKGTGLPRGASIKGVHLRLPGWGETGPTLEIYSYQPELDATTPAPNTPGLRHLAFQVSDVEQTLANVIKAGGSKLGEPVRLDVDGAGTIHFVYVRDPEGNIIELQRWD